MAPSEEGAALAARPEQRLEHMQDIRPGLRENPRDEVPLLCPVPEHGAVEVVCGHLREASRIAGPDANMRI